MTKESPVVDEDKAADPFGIWAADPFQALNWLSPVFVHHMRDMGAEWLGFVAARLQEDVALQHALLHAKSPAEAQQIQLAFLDRAVEQYTAETGRMLNLSTRMLSVSAEAQDTAADDENYNV